MMAPGTIPLTRPCLGEEEAEAAARVVRSGWLAQGPEVAALEREFGIYLDPDDPPHVVAVSSCTAALHLCLLAADARVVIAPSYTFVATVNAIRLAGGLPVLADIDPRTYCLDPSAIGSLRVADAVIPVHQMGLAADIDAIRAGPPRAVIIEDAACVIGARYRGGVRVGARRDTTATCFSLHASKSIIAGEGGLIATREEHLVERLRRMRSHGVDVAAGSRENAAAESYVELGYNYRMTDVEAAIARVQLRKADAIVAERGRLAARYNDALRDVCAVPEAPPGRAVHAYQRYHLTCRDPETREAVVAALVAAGIACRRGLQVVHRQPAWPYERPRLPVTERVADTAVLLPLWVGMGEAEQDRVIEVVRGASSL